MHFALRATAVSKNGCRLELNLIMHPTHPKSNLSALVDNHLLGIPDINIFGIGPKITEL